LPAGPLLRRACCGGLYVALSGGEKTVHETLLARDGRG
jgi:hypothetical protein